MRAPVPWSGVGAFATVAELALRVSWRESLIWFGELMRGRKVRGWNGLCRIAARHPKLYRRWRAAILPRLEAALAPRSLIAWPGTIVALVFSWPVEDEALQVTLTSLRAALGSEATIHVVRHSSEAEPSRNTLAAVLATLARPDPCGWLVAVQAGDKVNPCLRPALAKAAAIGEPAIIYWDEDNGPRGAEQPWCKAAWDPVAYLAKDSLAGACAVDLSEAMALTGADLPASPAGYAALVMRLATRRKAEPCHVPLVLTSRGPRGPFVTTAEWAGVVRAHWPDPLDVIERGDDVSLLAVAPPAPATWPSVSIIIPTRDRADLLATCLAGLDRLEYGGRVETIIVDNGSTDPATLALLAEWERGGRVRVLRDDGPFNFSRLNNRAAEMASGELLCLLNNDVEATEGYWLSMLVRHANHPEIGAVGPMLLYPDGTIQHAGVATGIGGAAGHVARGVDPSDPQNAVWHAATRTVSVVTAACLLVRKHVYQAVGGMDEAAFAVAFNDVDFCLRVQSAGYRNIYCAQARLIHAESRTRKSDNAPDQVERFLREQNTLRQRWRTQEIDDPFYSPSFSRSAEQCILKF